MGGTGWRWDKILAGFPTQSRADTSLASQLRVLTEDFTLSHSKDEVRWRLTGSEVFTVKSLYCFLQDSGVSDRSFQELWAIKAPLKVKIFVWLVLKCKVLTKDMLVRRGWDGDDRCALCLYELETVDHLFSGCSTIKAVLLTLLPNKLFLPNCSSSSGLWDSSRLKGGAVRGSELATIAFVWWSIWLARNKRVFENKRTTTGNLLTEV